MTDDLTNAQGAPLGDDIGQQRREEPTHASLSGLGHFLAAAVRQVRPYWKEMSVVVMASIPQVALETAQPMLLMVLINAIVAHDTARVWTAVAGLVGLIPIYIAGNFLFEYMASRVGASVSNDLRMAAFWRLQALSVAYHRGRSRGDLLAGQTAAICAKTGVKGICVDTCGRGDADARASTNVSGQGRNSGNPRALSPMPVAESAAV